MIQDFVEENEGFCFVGGIVIHIATECFAEGVCRKMTNVELILEVELFQLAIDVLNRDMAVVFIALKNKFIAVGLVEQFPRQLLEN